MNDTKVLPVAWRSNNPDAIKAGQKYSDADNSTYFWSILHHGQRWPEGVTLLYAHADYRALEEQAAKDALDAERWRWLVAENNKGGSRAKFLICWWSKDGDGYESTTGTSVDGHDPECIVRLIDATRNPKEQKK